MAREIVVVMGNGTSIVFNEQLTGPELAKAVAARLPPKHRVFLTDVATQTMADVSPGDPTTNFEHLLGPLDRMAAALGPLGHLVPAADKATATQVRAVEKLVRNLYGGGVGAALDVVADASRATQGPALDRYSVFVRWVLQRPKRDEAATIRIFNLNYDSLLDSQLLECSPQYGFKLSDQADGSVSQSLLRPVEGKPQLYALPLRHPASPEYLRGRRSVIAYHLHGSLAWLRDGGGGPVFKVTRLASLRDDLQFFDAVRRRKASMLPVVVLTDRKSVEVTREPFATAYRMLETSITNADTVIIAGYGFGDVPLNTVLARALTARSTLPALGVIGVGPLPTLRSTASRALSGGSLSRRKKLLTHMRTCAHGLPAGVVAGTCLGRFGKTT